MNKKDGWLSAPQRRAIRCSICHVDYQIGMARQASVNPRHTQILTESTTCICNTVWALSDRSTADEMNLMAALCHAEGDLINQLFRTPGIGVV
jgi:hypothetical protein